LLPKWFIEPADMEKDLRLARRVLAPTYLKLVGGEPLLHPKLVECLEIARESGMAEIVSVTTNGFLLPRMPQRFWELLDAITISVYPAPVLPEAVRELVEKKARIYGFSVNWKHQNEFVDMDRETPAEDSSITREVYDGCWLRRRCHILSRGRFYTCTRPPHFQALPGMKRDFSDDGILLSEDANLAEMIREYLTRPEPLQACQLCKGGGAESRPHRQLSRNDSFEMGAFA
jgi:GTP 3',8-cyclase